MHPASPDTASVVVDVHPAPSDIIVAHLPADSVIRVHHPNGPRDYADTAPAGMPVILTIPGDRATLGWGVIYSGYAHLNSVRNGRQRHDRAAWNEAVRLVRHGGIALVHHELRDYYGRARWTAVSVTLAEAVA